MSAAERDLEAFDAVNAAAVDRDACPSCWCLGAGGQICDACREGGVS